ncbi:hypothetical protein GCM10007939_14170 [Amylibacter marinus]|uniref:Uncharacterized protein n=1 Tax=Amylibacter marinus TaxID=1475483 RepID=A0ABQ5VVG7_9RHOB|nr:hypothetical protein GCM10007939_14170 [Amylibacter marinus]
MSLRIKSLFGIAILGVLFFFGPKLFEKSLEKHASICLDVGANCLTSASLEQI